MTIFSKLVQGAQRRTLGAVVGWGVYTSKFRVTMIVQIKFFLLLTVTTQASPGIGHTSFFNHSEGGIMASLKQQMCQQVVDKYKRHRIYIDDFNMSPTTLILFL